MVTRSSKTTDDQRPVSLEQEMVMTSAEVPNVDNIREIMNDVDGFNDNYNLSIVLGQYERK